LRDERAEIGREDKESRTRAKRTTIRRMMKTTSERMMKSTSKAVMTAKKMTVGLTGASGLRCDRGVL
jgi:translation initiation factor 2 beta subunit (eIF-2beta)/eIF-5